MKMIKGLSIIISIILMTVNLFAQQSPTDVFYLAAGIDQSIVKDGGLKTALSKAPLSDNLGPRNVFQKAIKLVTEFNTIYPGAADLGECVKLESSADLAYIAPKHVFNVLNIIVIGLGDKYTEYTGERTPKTPSDVFQQLRRVSAHLQEAGIALKINLNKLYSPYRVYEANLRGLLPIIYAIAKEKGISYSDFSFPATAATGKKPKDVFATITAIYKQCAAHYSDKMGYTSVTINEIQNKDGITPVDVFDLTGIVLGELKGQADGDAKLNGNLSSGFASWNNDRKVTPGDVFNLVAHLREISGKF